MPTPLEESLDRLLPLLDEDGQTALKAELALPLRTAIRRNPLKADAGQVAGWARRYGWELDPIPYCPEGYFLNKADTTPGGTLEHRLGYYYVQDAASMLPVELFDFTPGQRPMILDMAASPGGKTTHLTARSGDRGFVLANDSSRERMTALRVVLQNWGAINTAAACFPGEQYGMWFPNTFDMVLTDAPCSMEGLRTTEAHPLRAMSDKERGSLAGRQARLLASAIQAAKPGGQIVYSTCTLAPEEDEGVMDMILVQYGGIIEIEDVSERLPVPAQGLSSYAGTQYDGAVQGAARIWPHLYHTAGFFAVRLTKTATTSGESAPPPARPFNKTGFTPLSGEETKALAGQFERFYGLDLEQILEEQPCRLFRREDDIIALPAMLLDGQGDFPVSFAGLTAAQVTPNGMVLSHDWAARFSTRCSKGWIDLPEEYTSAWLRGEDLRLDVPEGYEIGQNYLIKDCQGRFAGRVRLIRDRWRNLLPRR
jgi:16S rRNA (cytosine1407-C5)-methyltransferase